MVSEGGSAPTAGRSRGLRQSPSPGKEREGRGHSFDPARVPVPAALRIAILMLSPEGDETFEADEQTERMLLESYRSM